MVAGKIVLAKLAFVPMGVVCGYQWFSKAAEYDKATEELNLANQKNSVVLATIDSRLRDTLPLSDLLESEMLTLAAVIEQAETNIFRFGWLSRLWCWLRTLVGKTYYSESDLQSLNDLERGVLRFFSVFNPEGLDEVTH